MTAECHHGPLTFEPTLPDGSRTSFFSKDEPALGALPSIEMDRRWLYSLQYYVCFWLVLVYCIEIHDSRALLIYNGILPPLNISHIGMLKDYQNLLWVYVPKRFGYDQSYRCRVLLGALDHHHHLQDIAGCPRLNHHYKILLGALDHNHHLQGVAGCPRPQPPLTRYCWVLSTTTTTYKVLLGALDHNHHLQDIAGCSRPQPPLTRCCWVPSTTTTTYKILLGALDHNHHLQDIAGCPHD